MLFAIRAATLADLPAILAIERQTSSAAHWTHDEYEKLVKTGVVILAENVAEHVAEQVPEHAAQSVATRPPAKLCGFVCAQAVVADWGLENIVVATEFLRQGIADQLMRALIREAQTLDASRILLEVRESNLAARRLYEKHGFRESGRRRNYYNNPPEDAILYALGCESATKERRSPKP
ncbi:MAG: ribosomal protein S18-alanine N-acetyltransferase [Terriglobales bacterium]